MKALRQLLGAHHFVIYDLGDDSVVAGLGHAPGSIDDGLNPTRGDIVIMIETPRLTLRRFRADDLDQLCLLYADAEVRRFFPDGALNRAQTREELDWHLNGDFPGHPELGLWATIHRATGRFIGRCGFIHWVIEDQPEIEIAYLLAKQFWKQGLGAEVAGALVQHGLVQLALPRLIALIDPGNLASIRTAEGAGLRFERELDLDGKEARLYAIQRAAT